MFVRPQGHTKCVSVSNKGCKHNLCLFKKKKLHRAPLTSAHKQLIKFNVLTPAHY